MNRKSLKIVVIVSIAMLAICSIYFNKLRNGNDESIDYTGTANPAAVYCLDMGYEYKFVTTETGIGGVCVFPDNSSCEEWEFMSGKCGKEHSYCTQQGYISETRYDGKNPYSREYEVCLSLDGAEIGSTTELTMLEQKVVKAATDDELKNDKSSDIIAENDFSEITADLPDSFDWRNRPEGSYLTSVKNQGQCGSCWAFSAVAASEAALNIANHKTGDNYDLSEQYLVSDCFTTFGTSENCTGGNKSKALNYIKSSGIPDENCMVYIDGDQTTGCGFNDDGTCKDNCTYRTGSSCSDCTCSDRCTNWSSRLTKVKEVIKVTSLLDKQSAMKKAIVNKGPLAASLRMSGAFNNNIYSCDADSPTNHAIVIIGYDDGDDTWIVRNSWGSGWNGDGYFKVAYGECSIESSVYYPTTISDGPLLLSPTGTIDEMYPSFSWNELTQATKYTIQAYKGSTLIFSRTENTETICSGGICNLKSTKRFNPGVYTWKVQGYVDNKWSYWSNSNQFSVSTSFSSDFNNNATGWSVIRGNWSINQSSYYKTSGVKSAISSIQFNKQKYSNFTYEASLMRDAAGCGPCANRLIIRGTPKPTSAIGQWASGYLFQYTNDGSFSVWHVSTSTTYALKGWTSTSAINKGGWNTLKVVANGTSMNFLINNILVWSGSNSTFTDGYVGIGMYRDINITDTFYIDWANLSVITGTNTLAKFDQIDDIQVILNGGNMNVSP